MDHWYAVPKPAYVLSSVFEDCALLLIYGIMHPIAAAAIGIGIASQLYIVSLTISWFLLIDATRINNMCQEGLSCASYIIWPPLLIASLLYGYY
jgi:hypothetical protein